MSHLSPITHCLSALALFLWLTATVRERPGGTELVSSCVKAGACTYLPGEPVRLALGPGAPSFCTGSWDPGAVPSQGLGGKCTCARLSQRAAGLGARPRAAPERWRSTRGGEAWHTSARPGVGGGGRTLVLF